MASSLNDAPEGLHLKRCWDSLASVVVEGCLLHLRRQEEDDTRLSDGCDRLLEHLVPELPEAIQDDIPVIANESFLEFGWKRLQTLRQAVCDATGRDLPQVGRPRQE